MHQIWSDVEAVKFLIIGQPNETLKQRTIPATQVEEAPAPGPREPRHQVVELVDPTPARERKRIHSLGLPVVGGCLGRHARSERADFFTYHSSHTYTLDWKNRI